MEKIATLSLGEMNRLIGQVVDASMKVHTVFGPGLLENVYEHYFNVVSMKNGIKRIIL
jgi:hypothetical protein